jgi:hypothetical protein
VTHIAAMSVAAAVLYAFSFAIPRAPCWSLFFIAAATAWPIWCYQKEYALFARRAVLAGVTHEGSRIRRWFWTGQVTRVWHVFAAIFWAMVLLALANLLDPLHWLVLGIDAFFLGYVVGPVTRRLASDVRGELQGLAARRWPLAWINIAVVSVAFFAIDFFIGAPDTRGLAWHAVAEQAFSKVNAVAACPAAGWVVGALSAADALTWHASEVLIPSLPHQGLKAVAWALVLLQAGIVAYTVTRLYLGLVAVLDHTQPTSSRDFLATTLALAVLYLLCLIALRGFDAAWLAARGRAAIAWVNPCRTDSTTPNSLRTDLKARLQKARVEEQQRATERVDASVNALYADVERGVDRYLDWYFTVIGEYQRLGALMTGRFAEQMTAELEQRIFGDEFAAALEQASRELASESQARLAALGGELGAQVKSGIASRPCWADKVDFAALGNLERDALRASTSMGGGAAAGVFTARFLARRAAAAAATKASSKRVFQGAASLAGRAAVKRTGTTLVAAAGGAALCGPLAPLCALAAGAVTWITLDKAFITIDELRFRDEMRAEILASVAEQKAGLAEALALQHHAEIDRAVSAIGSSVERLFVPAREGM